MKTNEAPEKIYIDDPTGEFDDSWSIYRNNISIEYIHVDKFIEKVISFLNYKLDDIVSIRVPGTIIPHHVAKQELIEDFKKYLNDFKTE